MKDLALYLLSHIVENTEGLQVVEQEDETGNIVLTITVAKEDMGRVIGKEGKVIRSLRDLIKILAVKQNKHVDVVLAE
jgi:predicted RNA-binding protein YlqC (UPF0109 family)